jgi:hypothetical protein
LSATRPCPLRPSSSTTRSHAAYRSRADCLRTGLIYHVAFRSNGQLLVSEVWDSQKELEAFGKRVMPLLADVALEHSGHPEIFEVHNIIRRQQ